jgi:phosphatidate cytidylyltransferase
MASSTRWADLRLRTLSAAILIPLALLALWLGGWFWLALAGIAVGALAAEWRAMCARKPNAVLLIAGLVYFGIGGAALYLLRLDAESGIENVLFVLLLVWATDIGAYIAGRLIGGPKLAPTISPGKTWSGAVGGTLAALAVALAFGATSRGLEAALALSVVSQLGDLAESAAKRHFGVKDSGRTIPGHGGAFDRLDGLLAAAPLAALLALAHGPGHALWR